MTHNLTPAQQTQLENRDSTGQWKTKSHGDVDDTADVLGVSEPQGEPMPVDAYPSDENAARVAEAIGEQRDQLVGFLGEDGYEHARFGEVFSNGRENRDYDEQSDEQRAVDLDESVEAIHDIDPAHDIDGRDYEDALDRVQGLAAEAISAGQASDVESSYELAQSRSGDFRAMDMDDHADREDDVAERIKIELDDATAKS